MPLFNKRIINKTIGEPAQIPQEHEDVLLHWAQIIKNGKVKKIKETSLQADFNSQIIQKILGYFGAIGSNEDQTVYVEYPLGKGSVDLALGFFGRENEKDKIIAPFELKGAKTHNLDAPIAGRKETPVEQAWRYGRQNIGTKWVLVSNMVEIRLYNYAHGEQDYEVFFIEDLVDPFEYARFRLLLSADNLLSGKTQNLFDESARADKEIGEELYADYKNLRQQLIVELPKSNPQIDDILAVGVAQKILDRILFIAFAEDTSLLPAHSLEKAFEHNDPYNPRPVWQNFLALFRAVDEGSKALDIPKYNGGLFAFDEQVDKIILPNEICESFKKIGAYDFESEVSVTILGRIFEQSVSDLERLLARARGEEEDKKQSATSGRRKRDGIVYTPDYIAAFIVKQTLGKHIDELFSFIMSKYAKGDVADYDSLKFSKGGKRGDKKWNERELKAWIDYRYELQNLRVVDPACGSGVFLISAFDYLKNEYDKVNAKMEELRGVPDLFDPDAEILAHNLYGVDVNEESVEISKLSLWLKTARKGKELASLDHTIRVGDSLIEDSNFAYLEHDFNWHKAFPEVFANGGFDVVLGNPPYVRQELLSALKPYLQKRFEVYHGVADLYCYFFERGLRLLKNGGRMGYISSSTFFKTNSGSPLRQYLSKNASIETVTDFGDLQIFDGVTTYPAILTMRNAKPEKNHKLRFWKLNKLPKDNFFKNFDEQAENYPQNALGKESWELESPKLRALRQKIVKGKPTLKEVYGSPLYGIKTGRNEAFVIDRKTRDRLIAQDIKSREIIKPWLEGKDLKRWRAEPRDIYIIFARRGIDIEAYPAIKQHLEQYREQLEPKPKDWKPTKPNEKWKGRKTGTYKWYELQDAVDYYEEFEKPKIVYPHFQSKNLAWLDKNNYYCNNKAYIFPNSGFFELALLNSNCIWLAFSGLTTMVRGGYYEATSQNINRLPIPPASETQKITLADLAQNCQTAAEQRYKKQHDFRRRIADLCPLEREAKLNTKLKNWWQLEDFTTFRQEVKKLYKADIPLSERSDWEDWFNKEKEEITLLSGKIIQFENEINKIVYSLFELNDEEIKLLEDNI